jgi:predicted nucleic acid-binding protein
VSGSTTISKYPFTRVACDAGVLIELLLSGTKTRLFYDIASGNVEPCASELAITEAQYIICRTLGAPVAETKITDLLASNAYDIACVSSLRPAASKIKCQRAISLADCFTIALASTRGIPALFATREAELDRELKKSSFPAAIYFLDEL